MTITTTATVPTTGGSRYLQQLCKHWSHKFTVSFDPAQGRIELPRGIATLRASDAALDISLETDDAANLPTLKRVVAEHLDRFAFREAPLPFDWRDGDRGAMAGGTMPAGAAPARS